MFFFLLQAKLESFVHYVAFCSESHLNQESKICPDQAPFTTENSPKQILVDFDKRGQQGMGCHWRKRYNEIWSHISVSG